jgi:hypothetical protein
MHLVLTICGLVLCAICLYVVLSIANDARKRSNNGKRSS